MMALKILSGVCLLVLGRKFFSKSSSVASTEAEQQANEYQPIQSPSEIAAGHPLVGAS